MHLRLLHRMDETHFVRMQADASVRIGARSTILQVTLDMTAHS